MAVKKQSFAERPGVDYEALAQSLCFVGSFKRKKPSLFQRRSFSSPFTSPFRY